jgi:hypothetical protein
MIDNTRANRKGQKDTMQRVQSRKSKNDRQYKGQQKRTKRYHAKGSETVNQRMIDNTRANRKGQNDIMQRVQKSYIKE